MDSVLFAVGEKGEIVPQKSATTKTRVFTRASPLVALSINPILYQHRFTIETENLPLFWPRWDRLYPIPAKKSPILDCSHLFFHLVFQGGIFWKENGDDTIEKTQECHII